MTQKDIERLMESAECALGNAIAPYSGFKVGAALMTHDGKIYTASNVENPSLMQTMCAERIALYKAVADGYGGRIEAMAIVASSSDRAKGDAVAPCGSCRQLIYELARDAAIYLKSSKGIKKYSISELLPEAFEK